MSQQPAGLEAIVMRRGVVVGLLSIVLFATGSPVIHAAGGEASSLGSLLQQLTLTERGSHDWLERLGAFDEGPVHERLLAVTNTGAVVSTLEGDGIHVTLTPDLDRRLYREDAALILVHNHPSGTSLSGNDLGHLSKPGVIAVVAVGHDGSVYAASRGPHFDSSWCGGERYCDLRQQLSYAILVEGDATVGLRFPFESYSQHMAAMALANAGIIEYVATMAHDRRAAYCDQRTALGRIVASASARVAKRSQREKRG